MQSTVIEHDGRVVGIAVRVRGGFLFFSSDREFKGLEAKLFGRVETLKEQVAEIAPSKESRAQSLLVSPGREAFPIDGGGSNIVQLRPRAARAPDPQPEPPEAA